MRFKSYSLSDEDLQGLLPWLEKNLGTLDEGEEWVIDRNKDGGVSAKIVSGGRVTTNRVIPTTVAPKEPEKYVDPWEGTEWDSTPEPPVKQPVETEEETTKPAVVKGQRDFRRPSSIRRQLTTTEPAISRSQPTTTKPVISRRQPTTTEPVISRRRDTDDATQQVISKRRPTMSSGASSTKARETKASARYKSPVVPMEEDLPPVIDPYKEGDTATSVKVEYRRKRGEPSDYKFTQTPVRREGGEWVDMEEEATPKTEVIRRPSSIGKPEKKGKSFLGKVGGAVAGAAKSVAGMFDGEDEDAPPAWINDPGVGKSKPGLLRSTARSMAMNRAEGYGSFAAQEYWTDPKDGTTYMRYKPEKEELPSEVDMTDVPPARSLKDYEGETQMVDPSGPKPNWVDSPPSGMYVGKGKSRDLQIGVDKAMSNARSQYAKVVGEAQGRTSRRSMWIDPKTNETYVLLATPDTEKENADSKVKIESERFEGTPPENLDTEETPQLEVDVEDPVIIDQLTNPKTPAPVDNPEPIELPFKSKADKLTDTSRVKDNPVASDMVIKTQEAIGADWKSPTGQIVVTSESFEEQASTEPEPPYRIQINPNTNIAKLFDSQGMKIKEYAVGTGDTTGTRYGKKFFTPTGTSEIINKVSYDKIEGSYGPVWMGLDWDSYGLHGPHAAKDVKETGTGFENQGFVSHGCVRFMEKDLLDLANYLQVGSSVEVLPYTTRPLNRGPLRVGAK